MGRLSFGNASKFIAFSLTTGLSRWERENRLQSSEKLDDGPGGNVIEK